MGNAVNGGTAEQLPDFDIDFILAVNAFAGRRFQFVFLEGRIYSIE